MEMTNESVVAEMTNSRRDVCALASAGMGSVADELASLFDAMRGAEHIETETMKRIEAIVESNRALVHQTLRALYELQRTHTSSHPVRTLCDRCDAYNTLIAKCEAVVIQSLPTLDFLDDDTTAGRRRSQ
jgi:hypothetical protein